MAARKLQDLLRALPDDATLNIDATGSKMTVRAGRSRFNLQTLPAADYPRIGLGHGTAADAHAAAARPARAAQARRVRDGAAGHPLLPQRHAAGHRQGLAAGGGHRRPPPVVGEPRVSRGDYARQEVILPRKTVLELGKLLADSDDPVTHRHPRQPGALPLRQRRAVSARSSTASSRTTTASSRRACQADRARSRSELLHALQRAAILSNEKFRGVRLVLATDQLKIICTNSEQEEAEEELEIDYKGDPLDIGFNITYLLDVLQNVGGRQGALRVRRRQLERAGHHARARRLQVRRDADAHLIARDAVGRYASRSARRRSRRRALFRG